MAPNYYSILGFRDKQTIGPSVSAYGGWPRSRSSSGVVRRPTVYTTSIHRFGSNDMRNRSHHSADLGAPRPNSNLARTDGLNPGSWLRFNSRRILPPH